MSEEMPEAVKQACAEAQVTAVLKVGMAMIDMANANRRLPPPRLPPPLLEKLQEDPDGFAQELTAATLNHQGNLIVIEAIRRMLAIDMVPVGPAREGLVLALATFEEMVEFHPGEDLEAKSRAIKTALTRVGELLTDHLLGRRSGPSDPTKH